MMHFCRVYEYLTIPNIKGNLVVCMAKFQGVATTPLADPCYSKYVADLKAKKA